MTTAQMQTVVTAITNAGFNATITKQSDGSWKVRASSTALDIPVTSANSLATSQGVSGFLSEIEYV